MSSSSTTTTPVKRACDSCHRRKVKCIGEGTKPCKNCVSAGLNCTYNAIPQKKGPKGSRAKVLSELRENQRQAQVAPGFAEIGYEGRSMSPALSRTPGLLSPDVVNDCVEFFFANLYPSQPILHRRKVQEAVMTMEHSIESYCFITALCAYLMIQPNMSLPPGVGMQQYGEPGQYSNMNFGHVLLEESARVRKAINYVENPTTVSIITSFFYYGSFFGLDKHNSAWFHLREATTHAHVLGLHDEETYKIVGDLVERATMRRLFWLLFVTERAYAIHKHRPLTLHATIQLPSALDDDPTETVHINGFNHLVNLYKPFDETFIGLWNKVRTGCIPSWLSQLQQQLSEALPQYLEGTEIQAVDLRTSQQWLKTMVWQLSISHGFISSMAPDNAMNFKYPIEISRDLIAMSNQFSQQAMEVHGVGLIEKLFDVACTLTDVLAVVPDVSQSHYGSGYLPDLSSQNPRDFLHHYLTLLGTLRGGQQKYLPMLLQKIQDVLPNMNISIHQSQVPRQMTSTPHSAMASPHMHHGSHQISSPTSATGMAPNPRVSDLYAAHAAESQSPIPAGPSSGNVSQRSHSSASASHSSTPTETPFQSPPAHSLPMRHGSHGSSLGYGDVQIGGAGVGGVGGVGVSVAPPGAGPTPFQPYTHAVTQAAPQAMYADMKALPSSNLMSMGYNIGGMGDSTMTNVTSAPGGSSLQYSSHPGMEGGDMQYQGGGYGS